LATDKTVWCWGSNDNGQLGIGQFGGGGTTPRQVQGISDVVDLTASENSTHTCVRDQSNAIKCWGRNILGALGTGNYDDAHTPTAVPGLTGLLSVAAGGLHTCAVKGDGSIACWGANDWSQLGNGGANNGCTVVSSGFNHNCSPTPVEVKNAPKAESIYAGSSWSCIIASDGAAWCWGANNDGELGDGTIDIRATPVRVLGL
jgi:alpha-tubulin suppressor-like RCC1 family protein